MQLQNEEILLSEVCPDRALLKKWFFTKSIVAAFTGAFLTFWAFSFFGGVIFQTEVGFFYGGGLAIPIGLIVLVFMLMMGRMLQLIYLQEDLVWSSGIKIYLLILHI